jgi:hypothetical protein
MAKRNNLFEFLLALEVLVEWLKRQAQSLSAGCESCNASSPQIVRQYNERTPAASRKRQPANETVTHAAPKLPFARAVAPCSLPAPRLVLKRQALSLRSFASSRLLGKFELGGTPPYFLVNAAAARLTAFDMRKRHKAKDLRNAHLAQMRGRCCKQRA